MLMTPFPRRLAVIRKTGMNVREYASGSRIPMYAIPGMYGLANVRFCPNSRMRPLFLLPDDVVGLSSKSVQRGVAPADS